MVARIRTGKSMIGALNYNENKVMAGQARCLSASSFGCDVGELSYQNKLRRFMELSRLNRRSKTNVLHVSLNFDPGEKLSDSRLAGIAASYMEKIGFGDQPFLVYAHEDSAHPHIHILSTSIKSDGKRIPLHNIGRTKSESARKEIEAEFNLVRADGRQYQRTAIHPADIKKATYGKTETHKTITQIVDAVVRNYRFTSIPEFNAVLSQYNVMAISGGEGSLLRSRNGLLYSLIDKKGVQVGIPIKASALPGKPTLTCLQKQFQLNEMLRKPYKDSLKNIIDRSLQAKRVNNFQTLIDELAKRKVYSVVRRNNDGRIYGITFIDNNAKCVFNGSDLGKQYTAHNLTARFGTESQNDGLAPPILRNVANTSFQNIASPEKTDEPGLTSALEELATAEQLDYANANPLLKRKRRKRRKSI